MKRPKYLEHQDMIQDILKELRQSTTDQLMEHAKLSRTQVQSATMRLRQACRINWDRVEGRLVFYPTYASTEEQQTEPQNGYLICKYGMYYRPKSTGYTSVKHEAGRYSLNDAISISHPNGPTGPRDGMYYIHQDKAPSKKAP